EGTPAHIAGRRCPRHPRRRPPPIRNPEPAARDVPPAAIVMSGPGPSASTDPRPAEAAHIRPAAVVVGRPADVNARIPDIAAVPAVVLPGPVAIERTAVVTKF